MNTTFTLPAGTICKRAGIPFKLLSATLIECHKDNWPLIRDGFVPEVIFGDQQLARSQSLQDLVNPAVAQITPTSTPQEINHV